MIYISASKAVSLILMCKLEIKLYIKELKQKR